MLKWLALFALISGLCRLTSGLDVAELMGPWIKRVESQHKQQQQQHAHQRAITFTSPFESDKEEPAALVRSHVLRFEVVAPPDGQEGGPLEQSNLSGLLTDKRKSSTLEVIVDPAGFAAGPLGGAGGSHSEARWADFPWSRPFAPMRGR